MDETAIRVLLVEDQPADAFLVRHLLSREPPGTTELSDAPTLAAGLERMRTKPVGAVLLDLGLPDSQGLETLRAVRSQAPDMPVVVMTGLDDKRLAIEALDEGAQDYLTKGTFDGRALLRSVRYAVERERMKGELQRLARFPEENPEPVLRIAADGALLYANPAARDQWVGPELAVGKPAPDILWAPARDSLERGEIVRDHIMTWGARTYSVTFAPARESGFVNLYPHDTTAQREALAALEASEQLLTRTNRTLRALSACNQALVRAQDEEGLMDSVCRALVEWAGYRSARIGRVEAGGGTPIRPLAWWGCPEGKPDSLRPGWGDGEAGLTPAGQAVRTGEPCVVPSLAGAERRGPWCEYALAWGCASCASVPIPGSDGPFGALTVCSADEGAFGKDELALLRELAMDLEFGMATLHARRELERTAEELREATRIVEQSPVLAFRCLAEEGWPTVYISHNISRFGHDAEQLVGGRVPLGSIVHADDVGPLLAQAERTEREGLPGWDGRLRIVGPSGDTHWVDCRIVAERDAEGRVTGYSGVATDITKQVQLEAELRQSQKLEALGALAAGVAHDFNNLLVIIHGQSDVLLSELPPGDERRERLEDVIDASMRAAALTRQLLAFGRRQPLQPRELGLSDVVSGIAKMVMRLVPESIALEWDLAPDLPPINADPGQIEQVVLNLCVNARDAMPDGGTLRVATTSIRVADSPAEPSTDLAPGEYVVLRVADSGSGIDPAALEHIFEPFFTTKGELGTGLGLSVVYGIVRQSGGDITVTSEVGLGTSFDVLIPVAQPASSPDDGTDERAAAPGPRSGATRTVLLAEDDPAVRSLVTEALEQHGYRLLTAEDGLRAVALATDCDGTIDLLLTDVVMPGLSGPEVAERVRERHPEAKVVYMSGYAGPAVRGLADSQSGTAIIDKPFAVKELIGAMDAILHETSG